MKVSMISYTKVLSFGKTCQKYIDIILTSLLIIYYVTINIPMNKGVGVNTYQDIFKRQNQNCKNR